MMIEPGHFSDLAGDVSGGGSTLALIHIYTHGEREKYIYIERESRQFSIYIYISNSFICLQTHFRTINGAL